MAESPLAKMLAVMAKLRAEGGCPWDREQDHLSLKPYALEEVCELLDAIDSKADDRLKDELGDVLLQVIFHCQIAKERKAFDFDDVCTHLAKKMIRRHPHVFADTEVTTLGELNQNWDRIKSTEQTSEKRESPLDGIPRHLPALAQMQKLWNRAERAGLKLNPGDVLSLKDKITQFSPENNKEAFIVSLLGAATLWAQENHVDAEQACRTRLIDLKSELAESPTP